MNPLYITDLDGTLLNSRGVLSPNTKKILRSLLKDGFPLTIATARTPLAIADILKELPFSEPMILLNGSLIWDPVSKKVLDFTAFSDEQAQFLFDLEKTFCLSGFFISEYNHTYQCHLKNRTKEWISFFEGHSFPFPDSSKMESGSLLYALFSDDKEETLRELYICLKEKGDFYLDFYKDHYLPNLWFLEINPARASKGNGVKKLRTYYPHAWITAFGDSMNDLPFFEEADYCCAVSNGIEVIRQKADQVLPSNDKDGVVLYLKQQHDTDLLFQKMKKEASIISLPSSILHSFGVTPPNKGYYLSELHPHYRNIVCILLDGMGSHILQTHLSEDSFLCQHKKRDLYSVFPSTTAAACTALETGLFPSQSGYLGWSVYWPSLHKNVQLYPNLTDNGESAAPYHLAEQELYRPFWTDVIQEKTGISTSHLSDGNFSLSQLEKKLITLTNTDGKHVIYAYLNKPDHLLHKYGTNAPCVKDFMREVDEVMYQLSLSCPDTLFLLTADHGFIDVESICIDDYPELMNLLVCPPSIEPRALNFFVKPGKEMDFCKMFHHITKNTYRLYSKKDVLEKQLFGPMPYHPFFLDMLGDFLAIAQTPLTLFPNRSYLSSMIATHGGMTKEEVLVPLIIFEGISPNANV